MRTLGILGGMSWESTLEYYRQCNRGVAEALGGLHSAPLLVHSFDFETVASMQAAGDWEGLGALLGEAAAGLARAGADGIAVATNTMHLVAPAVRERSGLPLLHIADATGRAVRAAKMSRVGLMGTRFTMERGVYSDHLRENHGIETIVPDEADRALIHAAIFDELCRGVFSDATRTALFAVVDRLAAAGAEGVILGCTELPLLLCPCGSAAGTAEAAAGPLFDTTALHCRMAVDWILEKETLA
ncbi:aspartate racemase [Desulfovibrio sp. X2]|uniref:aspartate/glutamate racemase family protein n=1 Tax=Desulfovibrio sp. X2 TaxID=941449 RepID=UPI00035879F9|nr:aspartate/glutamate racemase family protein [Desulfovibrio sp. X2]EPR43897.1 aspartate racemase [Desulfovibrio sp. X2]